MPEIISRCGFRCDLCLIFSENLKKDKNNRQIFHDGYEKYYGDKLTLKECYCDGCMTDDILNPVLITSDCKVRPCVIAKGMKNCAYCDQYPCKLVSNKFVRRCQVEEKYGAPIPEKDYKLFIEPYESQQVLDKIRRKAR
jgi:hypothetical protein